MKSSNDVTPVISGATSADISPVGGTNVYSNASKGSGASNKTPLMEALLSTSLDHPNIVRLVAGRSTTAWGRACQACGMSSGPLAVCWPRAHAPADLAQAAPAHLPQVKTLAFGMCQDHDAGQEEVWVLQASRSSAPGVTQEKMSRGTH